MDSETNRTTSGTAYPNPSANPSGGAGVVRSLDNYLKEKFWLLVSWLCFAGVLGCMVILYACCSPQIEYRTTTIRDTTTIVVPSIVRDTIYDIEYGDTVVIDRVNFRHDTIIKVRYYPKTGTATVYVKPDTVRLSRTDTLTVYPAQPKEQKTPNFWLAAGLLLIAGVLYYIYNKFKK